MLPSDHFVRFYNEVFKALYARAPGYLVSYWRELGRLQSAELAAQFRAGGLKAVRAYYRRIIKEENCGATMRSTRDYVELRMTRCPSLSKVLDNDAAPFEFYCDHCMAWEEPVMKAAGLHAVLDMISRSEPRCTERIYADSRKAAAFAARAMLLSRPYSLDLAKREHNHA